VTADGTFLPLAGGPAAWRDPHYHRLVFDLAAGPDGRLWYDEWDRRTVAPYTDQYSIDVLDPHTLQDDMYQIPVDCYPGCYPGAVTVTRRGSGWFTSQWQGIGEVTPRQSPGHKGAYATSRLLLYGYSLYPLSTTTPYYLLPSGISQAPDGSILYFAVRVVYHGSVSPALCRVSSAGSSTCNAVNHHRVGWANLDLYGNIAFDSHGIGWFSVPCSNDIGRLDRTGRITFLHIPGTAQDAGSACPTLPLWRAAVGD
jgi:hypothetical protein